MYTHNDRFKFMNALDAHLEKLDLELRDMQRRVTLSNKDALMEYHAQLNSLEARQQEIIRCVEKLERASYETFISDQDQLADMVIDFGFEIRSTADEVLRLTTSNWVFHGYA
jgi:hypothetical protein